MMFYTQLHALIKKLDHHSIYDEPEIRFMPQQLYPGKRIPSTNWIGGWVGPRPGLEAEEKINTSASAWN
jgi:hypothetical protein